VIILLTAEDFAQVLDRIAVNLGWSRVNSHFCMVIGMELKRSAAFSAGTASARLKQMTSRSAAWR
jgi:hypothetical protein